MKTITIPEILSKPVVKWVNNPSNREKYLKLKPPQHIGKVMGVNHVNSKKFPIYRELKEINNLILKEYGYKLNTPIDKHDGWFISYSEKGHQVHNHMDKNPNDDNLLVRFNVMIQKPTKGGNPIIEDEELDISENEVWVCKAGEHFHGTTKVKGKKPRIMLSFGHYIKRN
jgi:hypothetical protein